MPGKANRARLGRSPVTRARDVLGALRLVLFAPEDLALVRGDPAERRRYLDDLLVARQPRYAGVRADYERVLKQRNALLRTSYLARKIGGRAAGRRPVHTGRLGRAPGPARRRAARRPAGAGARRSRRTWPRRTTRWRAGARRGVDRVRRVVVDRPSDRRTGRRAGGGAAGRAGRVRAPSEVERGVTLVGPHRDDLVLTPGRAAGEGVRQPRRVVVVRAGAAAGRVRPAARRRHRAGAGARRRVRRAGRRPPGAAGRAGRRREPGAGHLRGRRRRAAVVARAPATRSRTGRCAVSDELPRPTYGRLGRRRGRRRGAGAGPSWPGPCSTRRWPGGAAAPPPASAASDGGGDGGRGRAAARLLRARARPARPAAVRRGARPAGQGAGLAEARRRGAVFGAWERVVGAGRRRAQPAGQAEDGELTVEAESTAWATQLRLLAGDAAQAHRGRGRPQRGHEAAHPRPGAPSWTKGPRRVHGRGPRDTYG